jgi:hypothetical protein
VNSKRQPECPMDREKLNLQLVSHSRNLMKENESFDVRKAL